MRIGVRAYLIIAAIAVFSCIASPPIRSESPARILPVEIVPVAGHSSSVEKVTFSTDGRWIASQGYFGDRSIKLWEAGTGKLVRTFKHAGGLSLIRFSRDGRRMFAKAGNAVSIWDIESGALLRDLGTGGPVGAVAVSPDERLLAFAREGSEVAGGSEQTDISLWDMNSGETVWNVAGGAEQIAFSPDSRIIATTRQDNSFIEPTLKLWAAGTGRLLWSLAEGSHRTSAISFSPDSRWLAAAVAGRDYKYAIFVWSAVDGRLLQTFGATEGQINALAFSPDGKFLISGGDDRPQELGEHIQNTLDTGAENNIKIWEPTTGKLLKSFGSRAGVVKSLAISHDGKRLISGGDTLRMWDAGTGRLLHALPSKTNGIAAVASSPDGSKVAAHSVRGQITVWDTKAGTLFRGTQKPTDTPTANLSIAFSSDGTKLLAGGVFTTKYSQPLRNKTTLWDLTGSGANHKFDGYGAVAFSSDDRQVLSGSAVYGNVAIKEWDALTGRPIRTFTTNSRSSSAFSSARQLVAVGSTPDGRSIVSVFEGDIGKIWDTSTGRLARSFKVGAFQEGEEGNVWGQAVLSPDRSRLFAVQGREGPIKALDVTTGKMMWAVDAKEALNQASESWWESDINAEAVSNSGHFVVLR